MISEESASLCPIPNQLLQLPGPQYPFQSLESHNTCELRGLSQPVGDLTPTLWIYKLQFPFP